MIRLSVLYFASSEMRREKSTDRRKRNEENPKTKRTDRISLFSLRKMVDERQLMHKSGKDVEPHRFTSLGPKREDSFAFGASTLVFTGQNGRSVGHRRESIGFRS